MKSKIYMASAFFPASAVVRDGAFSHLDEADSSRPGSLVYCQTLHYFQTAAENNNVSAIITTPMLAKEQVAQTKALIAMADPRFAFFNLYAAFHEAGMSQPDMDFGVGEGCCIHPAAVVSPRVRIGNRVEIGANAVIEDFVHIMDDVFIAPNAVIGAEGLINLRRDNGELLIVRHAGGVEVGQGSQILAGAVIAKSLFRSFTRIGRNCQIGILANVGHGVSIGDDSVISGNSVIAGRTRLGSKVWVGASVSIAQGLAIGEGAQIKMGAVVIGNVDRGQVVSGNFALPHKTNMRHFLRKKGV